MAVNEVILELAKQISFLQDKCNELALENQRLVKKKTKSEQKKLEVPPALNAWMKSLAKNKEQELLKKYADRITSINKKDPGWNPPKKFFDI